MSAQLDIFQDRINTFFLIQEISQQDIQPANTILLDVLVTFIFKPVLQEKIERTRIENYAKTIRH